MARIRKRIPIPATIFWYFASWSDNKFSAFSKRNFWFSSFSFLESYLILANLFLKLFLILVMLSFKKTYFWAYCLLLEPESLEIKKDKAFNLSSILLNFVAI